MLVNTLNSRKLPDTMAAGVSSAAIYSVFAPISEATGLSLSDLNAGTGYMFLMFGLGTVFW